MVRWPAMDKSRIGMVMMMMIADDGVHTLQIIPVAPCQ